MRTLFGTLVLQFWPHAISSCGATLIESHVYVTNERSLQEHKNNIYSEIRQPLPDTLEALWKRQRINLKAVKTTTAVI